MALHNGVVDKILNNKDGSHDIYIKVDMAAYLKSRTKLKYILKQLGPQYDFKEFNSQMIIQNIPKNRMLFVKIKQNVNAGDRLSSGLVSTRDITYLQGAGQARNHLVQEMDSLYGKNQKDSRHFELLSKSIINTSKSLSSSNVGILKGDNLNLNKFKTKAGKLTPINNILDKYLMENKLHYLIGTKITRAMISDFQRHSINNVRVSDKQSIMHTFTPSTMGVSKDGDFMRTMNYRNIASGIKDSAQTSKPSPLDNSGSILSRYEYGKL